MTRPSLRLFFWVCLLLALFPLESSGAEETRPNILWISIEDTGPELGCYGDAYAHTPHIDRLAAQGARFTRAFSHSGVCAPTRSGIITGMYPTTIGTHPMRSQGVPPAHVKCFPEYLRAAGYYCTNNSKTDYNFAAPLTAWDENRPGVTWRNRPSPDTPFFAVINLTTSHESQIRQPEEKYQALRASLPIEARHDAARAVVPPYYPDTPVTREDWARYYDVVSFTDRTVGKILADLEADGLAESTIVFFWGDHGRGLPRGKRWLYDSGIQVPLVVRWPGRIEPGSVREDLVCFLDLAPTVLSLAGVEIPSHLQGQAFFGPRQAPPREYIYAARDRMDETLDIIRAVRDKRFKYLRNYMPEKTYAQPIAYMDEMPAMKEWRRLAAADKLVGPQKIFFSPTKPLEELYDTAADPHEIVNLADRPEHAATLARLRAAHERWVRETKDLGLLPEALLNERARPGGVWSVAAEPKIVVQDGLVSLECATEGASLAYSVGPEKTPPRWSLYCGPFRAEPGAEIRAKACRLGFRDSAVARTAAKP